MPHSFGLRFDKILRGLLSYLPFVCTLGNRDGNSNVSINMSNGWHIVNLLVPSAPLLFFFFFFSCPELFSKFHVIDKQSIFINATWNPVWLFGPVVFSQTLVGRSGIELVDFRMRLAFVFASKGHPGLSRAFVPREHQLETFHSSL